MDIIKALTSTYSLEGEFEVQKSIKFIEKLEDIELLKPYAIKLLQTNAKQAHFVSSSIEVISQQSAYIFKLEKELKKKKATLWDRIRFVIFGKKERTYWLYRFIKVHDLKYYRLAHLYSSKGTQYFLQKM